MRQPASALTQRTVQHAVGDCFFSSWEDRHPVSQKADAYSSETYALKDETIPYLTTNSSDSDH